MEAVTDIFSRYPQSRGGHFQRKSETRVPTSATPQSLSPDYWQAQRVYEYQKALVLVLWEQKTNTSYSVVVGNEKIIWKGNGVGQSKKRMPTWPR